MKQRKCLTWLLAALLLLQTAAKAQDSSSQNEMEEEIIEAATDDSVLATPVDIVSFRSVPDSIVANLKRDKELEYANDPAFWEKEHSRVTGSDFKAQSPTWLDKLLAKPAFRRFVTVLMVCLVIFAVVKIVLSNRLMLRRGPKQFNLAEDEAQMQQEDLDKLTLQAEQAGNLRLAVRYSYRKSLQQMYARGIIQLDAKSTNWDYVRQMSSHPLKNKFLLLTRAYEYVWYGEFSISGDQYQYLKEEFSQYNNSLA